MNSYVLTSEEIERDRKEAKQLRRHWFGIVVASTITAIVAVFVIFGIGVWFGLI